MTRVWLSGWEWDCCGEPFVVGDEVDFGIVRRGLYEELVSTFGTELAGSVDAAESHHEEEYPDRVQGRVSAIHVVTTDIVHRRELRRPGRGAPLDAAAPPEGEEWPEVRREIGAGVFVGTRPGRYVAVSDPVPRSARLHPASAVPTVPETDSDADVTTGAILPQEQRVRVSSGWLVDVDEN